MSGAIDYSNQAGAEALAAELSRYWKSRGFDLVEFAVEPVIAPADMPNRTTVYGVRSNLSGGLPPKAPRRIARKAVAARPETPKLAAPKRAVLEALLAVLEGKERPCTANIAQRAGLSASYTRHILGTLREEGYVQTRGRTTNVVWLVLRDVDGVHFADPRRWSQRGAGGAARRRG